VDKGRKKRKKKEGGNKNPTFFILGKGERKRREILVLSTFERKCEGFSRTPKARKKAGKSLSFSLNPVPCPMTLF